MADESKSATPLTAAGGLCVITGGNTGIGKGTVGRMAARGFTVVMACRTVSKGEAAVEDLKGEFGVEAARRVRVMALDLASLASVRAFAAKIVEEGVPLNVLILNAGLSASFTSKPKATTADGLELTMGVNHAGHMLLTLLLLPLLVAAGRQGGPHGNARVVALSSMLHKDGKIDVETFLKPVGKAGNQVYADSKLANLHFTNELNRQAAAAGLPINANSLHPGFIPGSEFLRGQSCCISCFVKCCCGFVCGTLCCGQGIAQNVNQGSDVSTFVATSKTLEGKGGLYFHWNKKARTPTAGADDAAMSKRIWDATAAAVNVSPTAVAEAAAAAAPASGAAGYGATDTA